MDEQDLLWDIFSRNNIEEATAEIRFDGEFEIKIHPRSKAPIVFEPIVFESVVGPRLIEIKDLIKHVAANSVFSEETTFGDLRKIFIITFFTKNKRISVGSRPIHE